MRHHHLSAESALLTPDSAEFYFWLRHARRSEDPIVVLNAGVGRVAWALAQHTQHMRIVAVEADDDMRQTGIAQRASKGLELRWLAGDATNFSLTPKAGMIALPDYAFQQLLTLNAQRTALRHIHQRLQIGGKLVLILDVPDMQALAASQQSTSNPLQRLQPLTDPTTGQLIYVWQSRSYHISEQRASTHLIYELVDQSGETIRRWHRSTEHAYLWPRETQLLLEGMKFDIEACYGGWNDEPLDNHSTIQVWVARKGI